MLIYTIYKLWWDNEGKAGKIFMTDRELQKLKRVELLEMLMEQSKEVERLQSQLEEMQAKLEDREIRLDQAGNIAEASLQINGLFEAAQAAAQQYLENIQQLSDRQELVCMDMAKETREKCEAMEAKTRAKCAAMEKEMEEKCAIMYQEAKSAADQRWKDLSSRLEEFYNAHKGLHELIEATGGIQTE